MKRYITTFFTIALLAVSTAYAQQNLRTAYFLDGYTYNYKLNPSFAPERSFFAFPFLGNVGVGMESNLGLSTFCYPTEDGGLTSFLNSSVSDKEFLDRISNVTRTNVSVNESILSTGFRVGRSFHTIDISLKADGGSIVPKEFYSFLKSGSANGVESWNISDVGVRVNSRLELSYGYSRSISDWMRIGARLKLLLGMARADLLVDDLNLTLNSSKWTVTAHGNASVSGPISLRTEEGSDEVDIDNVEAGTMEQLAEFFTVPSIGAAMDLGVSFDFLEYFTASVSVIDLGFIGWKGTATAEMPGGEWSFDGFENIGTDGSGIDGEIEELGSELLGLMKLKMTGDNIKKNYMLGATVHAGIEARMPFYERLSFGLLGTQRIDGPYSWTEGRISANLAPVNWFSLSTSYAYSNFGNSFGGAVNIHLPGFNLYAGLDSFLPLMEMTPQYYPVNDLNTNVTMGLTFTFGKAVGRYRKAK